MSTSWTASSSLAGRSSSNARRISTGCCASNEMVNYVTGLISQAVEKAIKMQSPEEATPIADDRIFDR